MIFLAAGIFVWTLVFVIWQPRGLSIGWSALGGAALALLFGGGSRASCASGRRFFGKGG